MFRQPHLEQHVDPLAVEPGLVRRPHRGPRPAAAALHLAALHRQIDVVAARIAGNDLELGAEYAVGDLWKLIGIAARSGGADHQFLAGELARALDAAGVPGDADTDLVVGRADPVEFGRLELGGPVAEE